MGWQPFKKPFKSFTPAKTISNAFKITGESFQPAEILRVGGTTALVVGTGGVGASAGVLPLTNTPLATASLANVKVGNTQLTSSDPNKASVLGAGAVGVYSLGTVQAGNPDNPETLVNKISRLIGGTIGSYGVGKSVTALAATSPTAHALPTDVQGPVQDLSFGEKFGNYLSSSVSTASTAYAGGSFSQAVLSIFGRETGGAILQLLSGDIAGFVKTVTTPTPTNPGAALPPNLFGNFQSGGGGGGLGVAPKTGQISSNSLLFPVIGIAVLVIVWLVVRKK